VTFELLDHAECEQVVGAEDAGRSILLAEIGDPVTDLAPGRDAQGVRVDGHQLHVDAALGDSVLSALTTFTNLPDAGVSTDDCNAMPTVRSGGQQRDAHRAVVDGDATALVSQVATVDEHHWRTSLRTAAGAPGCRRRRRDEDALDPLLFELRKESSFATDIARRIANDEHRPELLTTGSTPMAMSAKNGLARRARRGDRAALARAQVLALRCARSQFIDGGQDALSGSSCHHIRLIEHVADGADGHPARAATCLIPTAPMGELIRSICEMRPELQKCTARN